MIDPFGFAAGRFSQPGKGDRHPVHPGWPESTPAVMLPPSRVFPRGARVRLRPLHRRDGDEWRIMRIEDEQILRPVEPTVPGTWEQAHSTQAWWNHLMNLREAAKAGAVIPLAIEVGGRFAGQVTLGNIQHGIIRDCWIGYWVYSGFSGAGVATAACGLGTDFALRRVGLHRVTATYLPDNPASGKVLAANGYREEGFLRRNLHIDGQWRDHHFVAITSEDYRTSCVARLVADGRINRV